MSCHIRRSDCFLQCYLMTILHQSHQRAQDSNKLQILFGKRFATYFITEFNNFRALTRVGLGKWTSTTDRWGPFSEDLFRWFKYPVLRPDLLIAPSGQNFAENSFLILSDRFIVILFSARWFVCNGRLSLAEDLDELRSWVLFRSVRANKVQKI